VLTSDSRVTDFVPVIRGIQGLARGLSMPLQFDASDLEGTVGLIGNRGEIKHRRRKKTEDPRVGSSILPLAIGCWTMISITERGTSA